MRRAAQIPALGASEPVAAGTEGTRYPGMPKLPWIDFLNGNRGAHLVWGRQSDEEQDLRPIAAKLSAVIERQKPNSNYAVGVLRASGVPRVGCAFSDQATAVAVAEIVGAKLVEEHDQGWSSERRFTLDARTLADIDRAAGTRRRRRRA